MGGTALAVYALAAAMCVSGFVQRQTHVLLVASFPIIYFAFISAFEVRNDRTLLLLAPTPACSRRWPSSRPAAGSAAGCPAPRRGA